MHVLSVYRALPAISRIAQCSRMTRTSTSANPVHGALAALSLSALLSSLGISIANVGLPAMALAFGASFHAVQWIVLAYLLSMTALVISAGRLGDISGRKRLLLIGLAIFAVASFLCGFANTLWQLLAARAIQGIGAAVMMALTLAFVGESVPHARIGSAMGLLGTMSAIGTALGPSLGGIFIDAMSWRALFLLNVPLGVAAFMLARRFLPADRRAPQSSRVAFDVIGTVILAITLTSYAMTVTMRGAFRIWLAVTTVLGFGMFILVESRVSSPMVRLSMLRERALRTGLLTSALVATVMMSTLVVGPFFLSHGLGLDASAVGVVLSVGPIVTAFIGIPAGRFADQFGAQRTTVAGLIGMAAGSLLLSILPVTSGIVGYIGCIAVLTAGYGLFQTANNTAVMSGVVLAQRGVTSGMLTLSRNLGLITGASAMGALFAFASSSTDITVASVTAIATGMHATFAVAAVLIVCAIGIAMGSVMTTVKSIA